MSTTGNGCAAVGVQEKSFVPGGDCSGLTAAAAAALTLFGCTGKVAAAALGARAAGAGAAAASTVPTAPARTSRGRRIRNEASSTLSEGSRAKGYSRVDH